MSDMEDTNLFEYEYTMPDTPESNRLVINMDEVDASCNACPADQEFTVSKPTTASDCDPLPSFDMFSQTPTMSRASCWYSMPSIGGNVVSDVCETVHTESDNQIIETACEKQESGDRSFLMDSILGLEQNCYNPRHSTPAKAAYTRQMTGTGSSLNCYEIQEHPYVQTLNANNELKQTNIAKTSSNAPVYKRQADKPPYSYVAMLIVAILNSEEKQLTLAGIREKLMAMFPFFKGEYTGWKNSIRHALSNSKCFYKVETSDELGTNTVFVWKVNAKFVKPHHTFNRHSKGPYYDSYKLTLQEELGLPPYDTTVDIKEDIQLPPKPCFQADSVSLASSVSDDFLNARNDSVPTPQSTISDIDSVKSVSSSVTEAKPSLKRKHTEDYHGTQQTSYPNKRQFLSTDFQYPYYGYQYSTEDVRPYDPYFSYYPTTNFTSSQQWSRDLYQYGNPQQTLTSAQPLMNFNNNTDDLALKQWWYSQAYCHGIGSSSFQSTPYSNNSDWFPSAALNLTKDKISDN